MWWFQSMARMVKSRTFWTWLATLVLLITVASFVSGCETSRWDREMDAACANLDPADEYDAPSYRRLGCDKP